ncbi:hypothetical protein [Atopobacter phocae]|uniref:hypothetical protein n=1 Tax=Atopobacter phocae TaxID=136492 RepID=UPI00046FD86B|nr:hypothetical protein [Atopobacter phocae]
MKYTTERLTTPSVGGGYLLKDHGTDNLIGMYRDYDVFFAHLKSTNRLGALEDMLTLRPIEAWHEDYGCCLWWDSNKAAQEPMYVGSPLDTEWNENMKFFIEIPNPITEEEYENK